MESDFLLSDWDYLTIDIYGLSATNQPDALGEKTQSHNKTNLTNITETKIRFFRKIPFLSSVEIRKIRILINKIKEQRVEVKK